MHTVYILRSIKYPERYYVGLTRNLKNRLNEHNRGKSQYSRNYAPWELEMYLVFKNRDIAEKFEKYLKKGSGYAFMKKHFIGAK